jgi:hypothetical protein
MMIRFIIVLFDDDWSTICDLIVEPYINNSYIFTTSSYKDQQAISIVDKKLEINYVFELLME